MTKYNCEWVKVKKEGDTNGRHWTIYEASLVAEDQTKIDVDTFDKLEAGRDYNGEITVDQKYHTNNFKLAPNPDAMGAKPAWAGKGNAGIKEMAREKNETMVGLADRRENSMTLTASFRDATQENNLYFTLQGRPYTTEEYDKRWLERRAWFKSQMGDLGDITKTKTPDFKNY